jgi:tetratricopeptide (TPR) repeat protein
MLNYIGDVVYDQGQYDEALKLHQKALKVFRRVYGEDHKNVAQSLRKIGFVLLQQKKYDEAVEMFEEALEVYTRVLGIDNSENAAMHNRIAKAKAFSGDIAGGLESARESVRIYNKLGITSEQAASAAILLRTLEGCRVEGQ